MWCELLLVNTDILTPSAGAYGIVCAAEDSETGHKVAIKKISPAFATLYDAKHTLREVRLMRVLGKHPNIICLEDLSYNERADELYVIMELMDSDLHRVIQSPQPLGDAVSALSSHPFVPVTAALRPAHLSR